MMFAGLVALLFALSGLNVINSFVGRNFATAIADREEAEFAGGRYFTSGSLRASSRSFAFHRRAPCVALAGIPDPTGRRSLSLRWSLLSIGRLRTTDAPRQRTPRRAFTVTTLSFILMVLNSSLTS